MIQINIRYTHLIIATFALLALLIGRQVVASQEGDPSSAVTTATATQLGSAFTYQGYLEDDGGRIDGQSCDFQFSLYDAADGVTPLAGPLTRTTELSAGVFTVDLDFGDAFKGDARYLGIEARCPAVGGDYTALTPHQAPTAVPYAMSAPWSGLSGMPAGFADGLDDANWLNRANPPRNTEATVVDDSGDIVGGQSVTTGADGFPIISYYDDFDKDLKVLHCENVACTSSTWTIVDSAGDVGRFNSIAIGADGLPIISYSDESNDNLKVVHCGNSTCDADNTITTVDDELAVGLYTSITIGADGLPIISYFDNSYGNLKLAHCGNPTCSTGNTVTTVDDAFDVGRFSSITIGADGRPIVSYADGANSNLKVAHCSNQFCTPYFRRR